MTKQEQLKKIKIKPEQYKQLQREAARMQTTVDALLNNTVFLAENMTKRGY